MSRELLRRIKGLAALFLSVILMTTAFGCDVQAAETGYVLVVDYAGNTTDYKYGYAIYSGNAANFDSISLSEQDDYDHTKDDVEHAGFTPNKEEMKGTARETLTLRSGENLAGNVYVIQSSAGVKYYENGTPVSLGEDDTNFKKKYSNVSKIEMAPVGAGDTIYRVDITTASTSEPTVTTVPVAKNPTYNGSAQELVAAGEATDGKMQYALGKDNTTAPTEGWSEAIPTATDVGTYYVWYKAVSDDGSTGTEPVCIIVTIGEAGGSGEDTYKVFVVKDRSNISGMFKKFGEKNYKYRFKVEDRAQRKIARVNRKGKIKVKKVGTVKVSLFRKVKGGTWSKVEEQTIKTEKPEIPKKITTLKVGDKVNATSFIKNNDKMINKPTSYLSSKPEVASIDSTGNITVKKSGRTKISIIYGKGKSAAVYKVKLKI